MASQPRVAGGIAGALVIVAAFAFASCGGREASGDEGDAARPRVAVSIFPLYDVARRVAGDRLDVVLVLPPGRSEHGYDPTPREMARVANARMALVVGLEMDEWAERIVRGASDAEPEIVRLGPQLSPRHMSAHEVGLELEHQPHEREHDHDEGEHEHEEHEEHGEHGEHEAPGHDEHHHHAGGLDPHFWLDPVRMQRAAALMSDAFARLDPEGASGYRERAARVDREIGAAHAAVEERARGWSHRTMVTFHGSFGYFADRYDLRIAAVLEPFPGREPTPRYMQEVLGAIRGSGAAALFSEPQLDPRPARVIAAQAGVPLFELDPIGGTGASTSYEALLRANADVLDRALR
ncbi:MAG: metal ABC transporter substrate-binding protein [Myxococcota bacterium]|nr:metal ABC transporter substrate-binding protein [Myxococcota bacterium]